MTFGAVLAVHVLAKLHGGRVQPHRFYDVVALFCRKLGRTRIELAEFLGEAGQDRLSFIGDRLTTRSDCESADRGQCEPECAAARSGKDEEASELHEGFLSIRIRRRREMPTVKLS